MTALVRQDSLRVSGLTIQGVSVGGVHTCLMVPELDVMFDIGLPIKGCLRYRTILVTHGHQDHLGALPYVVSQRQLMRAPPAVVHLPQEIEEPLRRIITAWSEIEDFTLDVRLEPRAPGDRIELGNGLFATCLRSRHRVPSLAWIIERASRRLRPEYRGLAGEDLGRLRRSGVEIDEPHTTPVLCVTGDTKIELFLQEPAVRRAKVLVHEVTAWDERRSVEDIRAWGHTHFDELVEHASSFEGEALVLVHRSARHSRRQAEGLLDQRMPAAIRSRTHVFGL